MTTSAPAVVSVPSADVRVGLSAEERRRRWAELGLVLAVALGTPILNSIALFLNPPTASPQISDARWTISMFQEVTALLVLAYVLSRRGLSFASLGLRWSARDVGAGLLVAFFSYWPYAFAAVVISWGYYFIFGAQPEGHSARFFFAHPGVMMIPFSILNPFFEELIVRAYLMSEVVQLTGSATLAVILSVAVQFSYHLYYGWAGAIALAFQFLVFALYYINSKRALPVIVAHAVFDIYALIRLF